MKNLTSTISHFGEGALVLLAAGASSRMGGTKKEYLPLKNGTVLSVVANVFLRTKLFSIVAVACPKGDFRATKKAFYSEKKNSDLQKGVDVIFVAGGETRAQSVFCALTAIKKKCVLQNMRPPQIVLIHDGARPFLSCALVRKTFFATKKYGAAVPALQPIETQKEVGANKKIARHLQRKNLVSVQTPQGFDFEKILQFHNEAKKAGCAVTDDTEIWDKFCEKKVRIIAGERKNIKITFPADLQNETKAHTQIQKVAQEKTAKFRTGLGYDLHRLVFGRVLILGGVEIPFEKGEEGHSDGDALLHAIIDALLGAAALGDIGEFFPDTKEKWRDADSKKLLFFAWKKIQSAGWTLENLDCVVKLEAPKFLPYRKKVCAKIAKILGVESERIFVKAKTSEGLGCVGKNEAVECWATCLLKKS